MVNLLVHPLHRALYSVASMLFSVVIYFWPFVNFTQSWFVLEIKTFPSASKKRAARMVQAMKLSAMPALVLVLLWLCFFVCFVFGT